MNTAGRKPARGAVLAVDHGEKRTGFALADSVRIAVRPLETWTGAGDGEALLEHIAKIVAEYPVDTVVVGFPLHMNPEARPGPTAGHRAGQVQAFLDRLRSRFPMLRVVAQDERLSTKEAEELLRAAGHPWKVRKEKRDSWSALVILRDWIAAGEPS